MKKTWIKIKRGLLDPKHREALGVRVWLYLYMLDKTNWENGIILEWTDAAAAEELEMPIRTLRDQRRDLEGKYISCTQKQYCQQIKILNWSNPREYSGEVYNKKGHDYTKVHPQIIEDYTQDYTQGSIKGVTPSLDSQNHIPHIKELPEENIFTIYEQEIGTITKMISDNLTLIEQEYPVLWFKPAVQEAVKNNARNLGYIISILKRWKIEGFQSKKVKADGIYQELQVL